MTSHERPEFADRFAALTAIAYRVAFRLLGDRGEAEEVAQEALARAYARWAVVVRHDEPWVARVATNLAIGRWRRRRPTERFADAHHGSRPAGDALAVERLALLDALTGLPRRQREVVVLRYLADLPEREVAHAMHTTVGTVKQHAHRALQRLRHDLTSLALTPEADDA
jgi:RNA polymerase sigma-70 factor (sigma-E family)